MELNEAEFLSKMNSLSIEKSEAERDLYRAQANQAIAETKQADLNSSIHLRGLDSFGSDGEQIGIFSFYAPVTDDFIFPFMNRLDAWSRRNPKKDMTIVFNSPGGAVFDGLALYDFISELKRRGHFVTTKCLGAAMSIGAVLLQAGDKRVMSSNSFFLIHEVSLFFGGSSQTSATEDSYNLQKKLQQKIAKQLARRSTISESELEKRWKKFDWLMDAEEALSLQFVDEIEE